MGNAVVSYTVSQVIFNSPIFSPTIPSLCSTIYFAIMLLWGFVRPVGSHPFASILKNIMRLWLAFFVVSINLTSTLIFQKFVEYPVYSYP